MDVMIDIESLSVRTRAVMVQIGAVVFVNADGGRLHNEEGKVFNVLIPADDQIAAGADVDFSTIQWWLKQPAETRERVFGYDLEEVKAYYARPDVQEPFMHMGTPVAPDINTALDWLDMWLPMCFTGLSWAQIEGVWANGPLDLPAIRSAYLMQGRQAPWTHRQFRDMKTILGLPRVGGWPNIDTTGFIPHWAPHDAITQAMALQKAMAKLK